MFSDVKTTNFDLVEWVETGDSLCDQYGQTPCTVNLINANTNDIGLFNYTNEVVCITGEFTINSALFAFNDCIIIMEPGASIKVKPGQHLELNNCKIFACNQMWKEIIAMTNSTLEIQNCEIEDGQYAVHSVAVGQLTVVDTEFNRNFVGILAGVKVPGTVTNSLFEIHGNQFLCDDNLNAPFTGQLPIPGDVSFAGIWVRDIAGMGIGKPSAAINEFDSQMLGILCERSNVLIRNATFANIEDHVLFNGYPTGIGVCVFESSIVRQKGVGVSNLDPPTFFNCETTGIYAVGSTIEATQNYVTAFGKSGFLAINSISHTTSFINNQFDNADYGGAATNYAFRAERSAIGNDYFSHNKVGFENSYAKWV